MKEVFLRPGEFHFGNADTRIRTLLGSCVSITLWHPGQRVGGMCHYLLPSRTRRTGTPLDGRYADEAIQLFDQEIKRTGLPPHEFVAKVFGGGNMFQMQSNRPQFDIGARNIEVALKMLKERNIPVVAEHHGGKGHRKLVFDVHSGDVWMTFQDNDADDLKKMSSSWPLHPSTS
jgi:chemotaxis protein CheD